MDHEWLKTQFRLNPGKTRADLAAALGLGRPAVSKILAGARQIKAQEYMLMRRFFGLPSDGLSAETAGRYVVEPLDRGLGESAAVPDSWVIPSSLLQARTAAPPGQVRVFAVQENAMAPDFLPGEHVLVDLSDTKPSPPGVFVVSDGMGHIVRQCEYVPHSSPATVRLSARSGKYEPYVLALEKAGIVGRVIAKLEWL